MPCQTHAVASAESLSQDSAPALDPAADSQQLRASQLVWDVNTGEELVGKPKKRQYTEEEQAEVTKNRGKVCEYHRRTKKKCDSATCPQNKQQKQNPPPSYQAAFESKSDSGGVNGNVGSNDSANAPDSQKTEGRNTPQTLVSKSLDQDGQLCNSAELHSVQCPGSSVFVSASASQYLNILRDTEDTFYPDTITGSLDNTDIGWCLSAPLDLDWSESIYSGTDTTAYVEKMSSTAMGEHTMSTACLEVPEYGAISSLPELPALEKVTDPSEAALELVSPVAERRACSEGVCGPRSSPLYVSSVPETVALPQLENRSVGRSFDCGGGSGGRAGGGGGSSWSFDRQPDPTYGFDECHRCPGQLPSEQKMASPPNRTRMGRKSKTMSPSPKKKSNYRSDTQKSHREKDEMDCLTSMMESASIANSRVLLD